MMNNVNIFKYVHMFSKTLLSSTAQQQKKKNNIFQYYTYVSHSFKTQIF